MQIKQDFSKFMFNNKEEETDFRSKFIPIDLGSIGIEEKRIKEARRLIDL